MMLADDVVRRLAVFGSFLILLVTPTDARVLADDLALLASFPTCAVRSTASRADVY
jgi:hypothetical protein